MALAITRAHGDDRRFAATLGIGIFIVDDDRFDLRQPGKSGDLIGVEIEVEDFAALEMDVLRQGVAEAHGDAALHLNGVRLRD